jgi:hypothetical protein
MKNLHIALSFTALAAVLVVSSTHAQRRGFASAPLARGGVAFARPRPVRSFDGRQSHARRFFPAAGYAPFAYADSGFNSAYEPMLDSPSPQIVYSEPYQIAPPAPPKPVEGPVLLELQGDHWVRTTSHGPPQIVGQLQRPEANVPTNPTTAEPSVVLLFRDGHREEIGKYCIVGSAIHISTDYWSTGAWTRTVEISQLDVAGTLKLNQERGTHFRLPSSPNEVMIGE